MLDKAKLIASFEEIVGWPYESPGTNDKNGIDCSGAFVRAYRAQGANIWEPPTVAAIWKEVKN